MRPEELRDVIGRLNLFDGVLDPDRPGHRDDDEGPHEGRQDPLEPVEAEDDRARRGLAARGRRRVLEERDPDGLLTLAVGGQEEPDEERGREEEQHPGQLQLHVGEDLGPAHAALPWARSPSLEGPG
ncbi:MAG: hypothetical protein LJF15_16950 [Acidobacteria bacterium]|nr:hypothetical protein [Acidobacteriota bacterium]